jgi:type I restriction enzyme S subunit
MMTSNKPKRRFSQFSEDWLTKSVAEIFTITAGGDISKEHVSTEKSDQHPYPIYANASEKEGLYGYSDIFKITAPAITVAGRGVYIGIVHVRKENFYPIVRLLVLKPKSKENVDYHFFSFVLGKINLFVESTGVPQLTAPQYSKYEISFPSLPEQQKIASFLSSVDERIELLEQKKEKLEVYKKGVMQQVFSQQIRFRQDDGAKFPDWEERKLGEVCEKKSSSVTAGSLEKSEGRYKIYGATGFLQYVDFYMVEKPFISIVKDGAGVGRVLRCEPKSSVLGTLDILIPKKDLSIDFLHATLSRIQLTKYVTGSTIPHIYFKDYSNERVFIPCRKEQQRITSFLSSLDESMITINGQIQGLKIWKKGLLQEMFV